MPINTAVIIGSGTMGQGIAQVAATAGLTTHVFDANAAQLPKAQAAIEKSLAKLAEKGKLKPAFDKEGTVTAGNASQLTDGAAMVLGTSEEEAAKRGWPVRARILGHTTFGVPPKELFIAPVGAVRAAVERSGLKMKDIDLFEINEAFASQMLACMRQLEIPRDRVNVLGGAIALGHPIGCSGTRVLVTLINALEVMGLKRGVASLCLGAGNAVAMVIERP